jgi:hypothetical protein
MRTGWHLLMAKEKNTLGCVKTLFVMFRFFNTTQGKTLWDSEKLWRPPHSVIDALLVERNSRIWKWADEIQRQVEQVRRHYQISVLMFPHRFPKSQSNIQTCGNDPYELVE